MTGLVSRGALLTLALVLVVAFAPASLSAAFEAPFDAAAVTTAGNAACPGEGVFYDPGQGEDIVVPEGFKVEVFARDLNFPTGLAFMQTGEDSFQALVVESGTGLPGRCQNNEDPAWGGKLSKTNPLTPDLLVLNQHGHTVRGPLFKPTSADPAANTGYQPDGPAIGLAFERGVAGGTLFATDFSATAVRSGRTVSRSGVNTDLASTAGLARSLKDSTFGPDHGHQIVPRLDE